MCVRVCGCICGERQKESEGEREKGKMLCVCLKGREKERACESMCAWVLCVSVCVDSCQEKGGGR